MAKIRFKSEDEAPFVKIEAEAGLGAESGSVRSIRKLFGEEAEPELFEVLYGPDHVIPPHAHVDTEIIYVLEGTLMVGRRAYGPGSAILVPEWTLYSFNAGPEGLRFLNFRPQASARRLVSKDEFLAERKALRDDKSISEE